MVKVIEIDVRQKLLQQRKYTANGTVKKEEDRLKDCDTKCCIDGVHLNPQIVRSA